MSVSRSEFDDFIAVAEPKLRYALVARFGVDAGSEATGDALTYAWRKWDKVSRLDNPVGYLYRVGRNRAVRLLPRNTAAMFPAIEPGRDHWFEPGLPAALRTLTAKQRQVVVLVHAFEWTQAEVAELLGIKPTTVQNHLERGLAKLRDALKATSHA